MTVTPNNKLPRDENASVATIVLGVVPVPGDQSARRSRCTFLTRLRNRA